MHQNQSNRIYTDCSIATVDETFVEKLKISAEAIMRTMGPWGKNVFITTPFGAVVSTKDGVTVARNLVFKERVAQLATMLLIDSCRKTEIEAGDGTTTAAALVYGMIKSHDPNKAIDHYQVARDLKNLAIDIENRIKLMSTELKTKQQLYYIAKISCNGNESLARVISDAVWINGSLGKVLVTPGDKDGLEYVEGYSYKPGVIHKAFLGGGTKIMVKKPRIIMCTDKLTDFEEIKTLLASFPNSPAILICDDLQGSALSTAIANFRNGNHNVIPVHCPYTGQRRKEVMEDIASMMDGELVIYDKMNGLTFKDHFKLSDNNGYMDSVTVMEDSVIFNKQGDRSERVKYIMEYIESKEESFKNNEDLKNFHESRIVKLEKGTSSVVVGCNTEVEKEDKMRSADDAILACQSALKSGFVTGGGTVFFNLSNDDSLFEGVSVEARDILRSGLREPIKRIFGIDESRFPEDLEFESGQVYDRNWNIVNDDTVIDPALVLISAMKNAISVVAEIITSHDIIFIHD